LLSVNTKTYTRIHERERESNKSSFILYKNFE